MNNLAGIGVSPGVVVGPIRRIVQVTSNEPIPATPRQVFSALEKVALDLEAATRFVELEVAKDVLGAQAIMASDPALVEAISAQLSQDILYGDVRSEVDKAFGGFKAALTSLGGYFAERTADLDEIMSRLLAKLAGTEQPPLVLNSPCIIVAADLTPSEISQLNLEFALAVVVSKGSPTSHAAIVARGLGIPVIVGCEGILELTEGAHVLVDGREGKVFLNPSVVDFENSQQREELLRTRTAAIVGPAQLNDGTPVTLLANVADLAGVKSAASVGTQGIGLLRTELLFLESKTEPQIEEQIATYKSIFAQMKGLRVVIRTLDAGSDKPVPYLNVAPEENPALGIRGWRLTRTNDDVINRQLEAISKAADGMDVDLWVMAPMINTPAEAQDFATRARALGIKKVGVMIETPAAALHADKVLAEVDFGSFGTNDLTQYIMASDRLDSRLADMTTTWHPAVLRAIAIACDSAKTLNKSTSVCGESAANPYLAAVLLGLGVNALSMAPSAISEVRGFLSTVDFASCVEAANKAVGARSALEAETLAKAVLEK